VALPLESSAEDPRLRLTNLRNGLLHLHSILLHSERGVYEREIQRIRTQGQFLELVLHDPAFAWLRELSQFVVLIDERLEEDDPPSPEDANRLVARARALLSPSQTGAVFETRYLDALQRDPDVVLAHSAILNLLKELK
jgi:hypothetical protein